MGATLLELSTSFADRLFDFAKSATGEGSDGLFQRFADAEFLGEFFSVAQEVKGAALAHGGSVEACTLGQGV